MTLFHSCERSRSPWAVRRAALVFLFLAGTIGLACSPSTGAAPPCETVYANQCGKGCVSDAECAAGLYCGPASSCTSDCAAGAQSCPSGFSCSPHGRCEALAGVGGGAGVGGDTAFIPGSIAQTSTDAGTCAGETRKGEGLPLDMFVMWDRSGSMNDDVNGGRKWDLVVAAFNTFLNDPQSASIGVGIQYFPLAAGGAVPDNSNFSCNVPDYAAPAVAIAPLPGNAPPISASLVNLAPAGRTPTRVALDGAIQYAAGWATAHPDRKVIVVLQTDGDPNVCSSTVPAVAQVATSGLAGTPSIPTYVIGVGSSLGNLNQIAQAGGTGQALIVDTAQDTTQQFIDAMNAIRGSAQVPCEYKVPATSTAGAIDVTRVNVNFTPNGATSPTPLFQAADASRCDPQAGGWYYDVPQAPTKILLCDATCNAVKADAKGQIDVELGCVTKQIPAR